MKSIMIFSSFLSKRQHRHPYSCKYTSSWSVPAPLFQMPTSDRMISNNVSENVQMEKQVVIPVVDNLRICRTMRYSFQQRLWGAMEGVGPLAAVLWVLLLAIVSVVTVSRPTKGAAFHEHNLPLLTSELVKRLHTEHVHHLSRNHHQFTRRLEANLAAVAANIHNRQQQLLQQNCTHEECVDFLRSPQKIKLTPLQKQQVSKEQHFIRRLKCLENFERADPEALKREIVELTHKQKNDILTYYRSYFQNAISLPPVPKRTKRGLRICPRQQSWDDLYLALTNENEVVQVVQFPETDDQQWILNERCSQPVCNQVANCICKQTYRLVRALVIRFEDDSVEEKFIKVYCCNAELV